MLSNLSASINETPINYPIADSSLPFSDYINLTRAIIEERRNDLAKAGFPADLIINTNSPYELYPSHTAANGQRIKYGALLIHGLLDCPFSLRDIGKQLQANGILSRAILLPGHGTAPADLINISYHDWIQAVRYGVESLRNEVDEIFLVGYSTGAALSIYQAMQDIKIAGIILLSPAIQIKTPVNVIVSSHYFLKLLHRNHRQWLYRYEEKDYAKYSSIPFNAVAQVNKLTRVNHELRQNHALTTPVMMIASREDETISSTRAIDFFSKLPNSENRMLLYSSVDHRYPDPRIVTRFTEHHDVPISHMSHSSLPFAPDNHHYGEHGDFIRASRLSARKYVYGAYNPIEEAISTAMCKMMLLRHPRRELTYNPDFAFMMENILSFISGVN